MNVYINLFASENRYLIKNLFSNSKPEATTQIKHEINGPC